MQSAQTQPNDPRRRAPVPPDHALAPAAPHDDGHEQHGGDGHADGGGQGGAADHDAIPTNLPRPGTATILFALAAFAVLLAALLLIGLIPHLRAEHQADADAKETQTADIVVTVARPAAAKTSKDLTLPCDVRANQATAIYTRANGYLKKWFVDIQDHVEQGQLLALIDTPDIDAELEQSKASLEQNKANVSRAQADLTLAQTTLSRYQESQKKSPGSVTQQDLDSKQSAYDDAVAAMKQTQANVVAAQANVQQLTVEQGFERITAPFAGTITARNYDNGALLSPTSSKEIFDLAQTDMLRVYVSVPQKYATQVHTGEAVKLVVANYPGRDFTGSVARSAGAIDPNTRTLLYELDFPNKDQALYAGMYGQIKLPVSDETPTLVIPSSALVFDKDGLRVGLVQDGKLHMQPVQAGRDLGTDMEIASGLNATDEVVTNPGERMAEGATVKVLPPSSPPPGTAPAPAGQKVANAGS